MIREIAFVTLGLLFHTSVNTYIPVDRYLPFQETDLLRNYKNTKPHFNKALNLLARGDYQGAIEPLRHVIEMIPEHAEAAMYLGICFYQIGDYETALEQLNQAKSRYEGWHKLNYKILVEQFDNAHAELIELEGEKQYCYHILENAYNTDGIARRMHEIDMRMKAIRDRKLPEEKEAVIPAIYYFYSGNCLMKLGRYEEAYSEYMKAIETDQDYADAYTNLAVLLYTVKEYEDSWLVLQAARENGAEINPEFEKALVSKLNR